MPEPAIETETETENPLEEALRHPLEVIFEKLSKYHVFFYVLVFITKIPQFWHLLSLIFLSPPSNYKCNYGNGTLSAGVNPCPCLSAEWDRQIFTKTLQSKFDLYCDRAWLVPIAQTSLFVGLLIGSLLFGFLSDRYGRLQMYLWSSMLMAITGSVVSVMPSIYLYCAMRTIEGIGTGGSVVTGFVLCIEFCGARHRETITALYHLPTNLSHMVIPGVSFLFRDCDHFQLAISIPVFATILLKWLVKESPKWMMDNKKTDRAVAVFESICKFNKIPVEGIEEMVHNYQEEMEKQPKREVNIRAFFKYISLSLCFWCLCIVYFVCGMSFGISQFIGHMSGDIHTNVAVSGALLLPGTTVSLFASKFPKRTIFLFSTELVAGLLMFAVAATSEQYVKIKMGLASASNCCSFITFIFIYLFGVELYPTAVRNTVLGLLSVCSRVGQTVAPFAVNHLSNTNCAITFGVCATFCAFICLLLPDTKGKELPSALEEVELRRILSFIKTST